MLYNINSQPIVAVAGVLEGKDWIVELEDDKEQKKVTEFKLLGLLSFFLFLFYFIVFYIKRSINKKAERRYLIYRKAKGIY